MRQRAQGFAWLMVIGSMTACASGDAPSSPVSMPQEIDVAAASAPVTSAVERADAAIADLQRTLLTRLTEAMGQDDRAVGFAPGDLRGWFWAEVALP